MWPLQRRVQIGLGAGTNQAGYTGLPFKLNSSDGDSGAIYLFHNTIDAHRANNNGFAIMSPGTWTALYARNNVFAGTLQALVNANPEQPMDMDSMICGVAAPSRARGREPMARR